MSVSPNFNSYKGSVRPGLPQLSLHKEKYQMSLNTV